MISSPLCWPGGKSKLKKRIIAQIPPHKTYVEPFVGGGHVFFAKPLAEKNVINDLDKDLINFYKDLKKNGCKTARTCSLPANKKQFDKLDEKKPCGFLGQVKTSYGCQRRTYSPNKNSIVNHKKQCGAQQAKLNATKIHNNDFKNVIKKHNRKDTFAYIDPPYVGSEKVYKLNNGVNPEKICNSLKGFKGKFLLSYNDDPRVKKACKDFKIKKIDTKYELQRSSTGQTKPVKELLIKNY